MDQLIHASLSHTHTIGMKWACVESIIQYNVRWVSALYFTVEPMLLPLENIDQLNLMKSFVLTATSVLHTIYQVILLTGGILSRSFGCVQDFFKVVVRTQEHVSTFRFAYHKILAVTEINKCGRTSVSMRSRHLCHFELISRVKSPLAVAILKDAYPRDEMVGPPGSRVLTVERRGLS